MTKFKQIVAILLNTDQPIITVDFEDGAGVHFNRTEKKVTLFSNGTMLSEELKPVEHGDPCEGVWTWNNIHTTGLEFYAKTPGMTKTNYTVITFLPKFQSAADVRLFLKTKGFDVKSVNWKDSPFGGDGKFWVTLNVPKGVTLVHSSGSDVETKTFGDKAGEPIVQEIARLREVLKGTNVAVNH